MKKGFSYNMKDPTDIKDILRQVKAQISAGENKGYFNDDDLKKLENYKKKLESELPKKEEIWNERIKKNRKLQEKSNKNTKTGTGNRRNDWVRRTNSRKNNTKSRRLFEGVE